MTDKTMLCEQEVKRCVEILEPALTKIIKETPFTEEYGGEVLATTGFCSLMAFHLRSQGASEGLAHMLLAYVASEAVKTAYNLDLSAASSADRETFTKAIREALGVLP